jgi:hypothetical protein
MVTSFVMWWRWFYLAILLVEFSQGEKADWDYYPDCKGKCKYGIVMGGTPNLFEHQGDRLSEPGYSACIASLYARHHGYAVVIHRDLGSLSNRTYGECSSQQMSPWNKILLLQKYLPDVENLVWLDLDALINDGSFTLPISTFLPSIPLSSQKKCLPRWNGLTNTTNYGFRLRNKKISHLPGFKKKPFLFLGEDISREYAVNVNSAILVIRNVPKAHQFLEDVWNSGNDEGMFKRYDISWRSKVPCTGYWGWPWEQGGIWEILSIDSAKYLSSICILSKTDRYVFNNIHGDPELPPLQSPKENQRIYFAYHHSRIGARYVLKRLMVLQYITSEMIKDVCKTFVAPPYFLTLH